MANNFAKKWIKYPKWKQNMIAFGIPLIYVIVMIVVFKIIGYLFY